MQIRYRKDQTQTETKAKYQNGRSLDIRGKSLPRIVRWRHRPKKDSIYTRDCPASVLRMSREVLPMDQRRQTIYQPTRSRLLDQGTTHAGEQEPSPATDAYRRSRPNSEQRLYLNFSRRCAGPDRPAHPAIQNLDPIPPLRSRCQIQRKR